MAGSEIGDRRIGVAVGKFNPPHLGHQHLISTAASQVDLLYVLLGDRPDQTIPAEDRARWLGDAVPKNVAIAITPDDLPEENDPWAERALEVLPYRPTHAFTSEAWGAGWAAAMGAQHVAVDVDRGTVPISATQIRADLGRNFDWLVPAARAGLARRVVLAGAESTGKSTMAEALAEAIETVWVPEHGRWYWEGRRHLPDQSWTADEFRRIASAQGSLESDLARRARNGVLISDTDGLVTAVWAQRYLGTPRPDLVSAPPDMYLVCAPDFGWVQDGTRESEAERMWMHDRTVELAGESGAQVEILEGAHDDRLARALDLVRPLTTFPTLI